MLAELATRTGLPRARVQAVLASNDYADAIRDDLEQARRLGVTGIPFTVFDGRIAIPGSTTVVGFAEALQKAWDSK